MLDLRHIVFAGVDSTESAHALRGPCGEHRAPRQEIGPEGFLAWLLERSGLDSRAYRGSALARRLPACLRRLTASSPEAARALIERSPALLPMALGSVLIGASDFFRDAAVFDHLERQLLTALLEKRPAPHICSLGCSKGQELVSVAILLAERGGLSRCRLLGIDCRPEAVAYAARGRYSADEVADSVSPVRLARFFTPQHGEWKTAPELAASLHWRQGDLLAPDDEIHDLILCRNLLIYLRPEAAAQAWRQLEQRLAPGGFLVTGKAERPPRGSRLVRVSPSIFLRLP